MNIVARSRTNNKIAAVIPLVVCAVFIYLFYTENFWSWIPFAICIPASLLILKYASNTVLLSHDVNNKTITVSQRKKRMVFPLNEVSNISEGFTNKGTCSYYLTVKENDLFGKHIKFIIMQNEIECKDNYYILRNEIIKQRSKRAKEMIYGSN